MAEFVVVEKTEVYRARGRGGASWPTFHCRCAPIERGVMQERLVTVFFDPIYHTNLRVGNTFLTNATRKKRGTYSVGKRSTFTVTGSIDLDVLEEKFLADIRSRKEELREELEDNAESRRLVIEYISAPKRKSIGWVVISKIGAKWLLIPIDIAIEHFGGSLFNRFKWPNNGFGTLICEATEDDTSIVVTEIHEWIPDRRVISETVPLSRVTFHDHGISFELSSGVRRFVDKGECPFLTRAIMNEVRDSFPGELVITAKGGEVRRGGFRAGTGVWSEWVVDNSEFGIDVDDDVVTKFSKIVATREQKIEFERGIELIRKMIAQEQADINALADTLLQHMPEGTTREEAKKRIIEECWSDEYDKKFFDRLALVSTEIHPYVDGFVFEIVGGKAVVIERPVLNAATYVFNNPAFPGGISELLRIFAAFPLLKLRQGLNDDESKADVAGKVGLKAVAVHKDFENWAKKILDTAMFECEPRTVPLIKTDLAALAVLFGIELKE